MKCKYCQNEMRLYFKGNKDNYINMDELQKLDRIGLKGKIFISEDKIKAKIKELEKGNKNTFIRGEKILVLQSLLEKEE